jgi:hypothetical protein
MSPRDILKMVKKKIPSPRWESNPRTRMIMVVVVVVVVVVIMTITVAFPYLRAGMLRVIREDTLTINVL